MTNRLRLLDIGTLLIAVPVAVPLLVVISALIWPAEDAWLHVRDNLLAEYISNTLLLMLLTGLLAGFIGTATASICTQYRFFGDRWIAPALVLPLAIPTYVAGYIYAEFLEYSGPVQSTLRETMDWEYGDYHFPTIRSLPGAALVMASVLYPYVYLLVRANLEAQSSTLIQAARVLGVSGFRLYFGMTIPLARPAIAGGTALVLMETAAEFGLVEHFGVPTLTTGVFRTWLAMGELSTALRLASWLFIIVVFLVIAEQLSRRGARYNPAAPAAETPRRKLSGIRSALAFVFCATPAVIGFLIPCAILILHAVEVGDPLLGRRFATFIGNTLLVALVAACLCVIGATWLAYAARLRHSLLSQYAVRLATLGYAIPGLVLAIGALQPLSRIDHWLAQQFDSIEGLLLTGSMAALIFVYVARFMTIAFNGAHSGLGQVHPSLDAAARSLGASPVGVLRRVHAPLISGTLAYAGLLVFIDVVKELPVTLILRPFNFETLATRVYRLASDERVDQASTAALFIVAVSLIPTLLVALRKR